MFNTQSIIDLQKKLQDKISTPDTEEATKQWFVMPLLVALGYDPYSSDIIPEYTLDVGTKKGEKVDYALQINNQPVAIVECKQLNVSLSDKHISQLYRYFTISNVHIAILTNGNDYWFFTDSTKENVMDLEPYYKIRLTEACAGEISKLDLYSKEKIQNADVNYLVQYERFQTVCKDLVNGLRTNNIPTWLVDILAERSGIFDIDKSQLAECLYTEIKQQFNMIENRQYKSKIEHTKEGNKEGSLKETLQKGKENRSNIKLNHLYVYNDYSDGDWKFHKLDYAVILGNVYQDISSRKLLINTVNELFKQNKIKRDEILKDDRFNGTYKISETSEFRGAYFLEDYNVYICTHYGIDGIVVFIQKLLEYANLPNESVHISFKE